MSVSGGAPVNPTPPPGSEELGAFLRGLGQALARRRRLLVAVGLLTALGVQVVGFFWPATYAARAALLIRHARLDTRVDGDPQEPTTVISGSVAEEEVNSEIALLTSREVLSATVGVAGLDRLPQPWYLRLLFAPLRGYERAHAWYHEVPLATPQDRAVRGLGGALHAERLKDSNVLLVTYEAGDPRLAEAVLDALLKAYLEHHVQVHGSSRVETFFTEQAQRLQQELTGREDELQSLKREAGLVDVALEREVHLRLDANLREEAQTLDRRLAELDHTLAAYERSLERMAHAAGPQPVRNPILDDLKDQVLKLELEQIRLETRFRDEFPLVRENRLKLEAARRTLENERRNVVEHGSTLALADHERHKLATEREGLRGRRALLEGQLAASRRRLERLDQAGLAAQRTERQLKAAEERYLLYRVRGERARIDRALDQDRFSNVSIVQRASASPRPERPKKSVLALLSLAGGLLAGLLACLAAELRERPLAELLAAAAPKADA